MSTTRFFSGSRDQKKYTPASDLAKLEIQKGGKLPPVARYKYMQAARYKHILKKRMDVANGLQDVHIKNKFKAVGDYKSVLERKLSEAKSKKMGYSSVKVRSKRAADALNQIAMRKAAKEAKAMRKMVIVKSQNFANGRITAKGKIYDIADNLVGQVNTKNGKMSTTGGWYIGKYKRGYFTGLAIQNAIHLHSPYYINLRKMQAMQQGQMGHAGMPVTEEVINLFGYTPPTQQPMQMSDFYGTDAGGPRQNVGVTAWGAMSNNTWGTFADNAWGTTSDNVWGTASSDVWGSVSGASLWGEKGPKIWGTGTGKNYLSRITNFIAAFFGLGSKHSRAAKREFLAQHRASNRSSGGSAPTAPRTVRR